MILSILLLILGLGILIAGGEFLVRGSSSLASKWGIRPLVIGLTVVAFGTSMPELIVNILSVLKGTPDIAIGNVIGSNTANILLILGISAIIFPLKVQKNTTWKEIPFALLGVVLLFIMANDVLFDKSTSNVLTRTDGLALIGFFIIFLYYIFGIAKNDQLSEKIATYKYSTSLSLTLGGLVFLLIGGKIMVDNAVKIATLAGLSETLIGLTIVAVGTSLPELITSVIATYRKQTDIAIGNVVGSNIFNIFWILGFSSTLGALPVRSAVIFDIIICLVATLLLFAFMFIHNKNKLDRWQGATFVCLYIAYIVFLIYRG